MIGLMRRFFALVVWLDLCTEMEVWRILIHDICQFWAPSHYLALSKYINNIAQIGQNRPKVKRAQLGKNKSLPVVVLVTNVSYDMIIHFFAEKIINYEAFIKFFFENKGGCFSRTLKASFFNFWL